jgi:hypothetical protein
VPDCPARRELLDHRDYLTQVLVEGGGAVLDDAPEKFRKDRELIMMAVQNGYTNSVWIVQQLLLDGTRAPGDDMDYLMGLVAASNSVNEFYNKLPPYLQKLPEVANAVIRNTVTGTLSTNTMTTIARCVPALSNDEILAAIRQGCIAFLQVDKMQILLKEKEFVCMLCRVDGNCLQFATMDICRDNKCLLAALQGETPISIRLLLQIYAGRPPQQNWNITEAVAEALIRLAVKESHSTKMQINDMISNLIYTRKKVFLACCETNWPNFRHNHTEFWFANRKDEDLALKVLKIVKDGRYAFNFLAYSTNLSYNLSFMKRAAVIAPKIIQSCRGLRHFCDSFEVQVAAVGSSREALLDMRHSGKDFERFVKLSEDLHKKLHKIDGFVLHFLGGICIASPPPKKCSRKQGQKTSPGVCHLPMLNLGGDNLIKRSIAEFADIPIGPTYKLMREASANLAFWGY